MKKHGSCLICDQKTNATIHGEFICRFPCNIKYYMTIKSIIDPNNKTLPDTLIKNHIQKELIIYLKSEERILDDNIRSMLATLILERCLIKITKEDLGYLTNLYRKHNKYLKKFEADERTKIEKIYLDSKKYFELS